MSKGDAKQTLSTNTSVVTTTNNNTVTQVGPTNPQGAAVALTDILANALTTLGAQHVQAVSAISPGTIAPASIIAGSGGAGSTAGDAAAANFNIGGVQINKTLLWSAVGGTLAILVAHSLVKGRK